MPSELNILLNASVTTLQRWCESSRLIRGSVVREFVQEQTWTSARALAAAADPAVNSFVAIVSSRLPAQGEAARRLLYFELGEVVLSGWLYAATSTEVGFTMGLAAQLRHWILELRSAGMVTASLLVREIQPPRITAPRSVQPQAAAYLVSAALEHSAGADRQEAYRQRVSTLRARMALSGADLARLLRVSREAVRQWESGSAISEDRWAAIDSAYQTMGHLLKYFKPERLPAVLRRPIPALENRSPWDLILMGREQELLRFYDNVLTYGVTA